jgi:hypothetical protein
VATAHGLEREKCARKYGLSPGGKKRRFATKTALGLQKGEIQRQGGNRKNYKNKKVAKSEIQKNRVSDPRKVRSATRRFVYCGTMSHALAAPA